MGCPCELQLFARSEGEARRAAALAVAEVRRLDAKYTGYRDDSFLAEINRAASAGGRIEVDPETASLLDYAGACHRESDGRFDVTAGALARAWRCPGGTLPADAALDALRARTGWHRLRWERPVLAFPVPGMELDLGGVVKEYAADRVVALCRAEGVRSGLVNLGGDLAAIGPRLDGSPWRIGIQHPRANGLASTIELFEGALATSGDYERCVSIDGQRYGHIVDPTTGWNVRHLASVSVVADLCVVAGSASTIAMLRQEQGPAWLAQVGLPHQWIDVHGASGGTLSPPLKPSGGSRCRMRVGTGQGVSMRRTHGFTLIEMMAVILILGLVMSLVVVNVMDQVEWAKVQTTKVKLKSVEAALDMFQLQHSQYPDTAPGLVALLEPGAGRAAFVKDEEALDDAWKRRFGYEHPGRRHVHAYDLHSLGRDGVDGGEGPDADITN